MTLHDDPKTFTPAASARIRRVPPPAGYAARSSHSRTIRLTVLLFVLLLGLALQATANDGLPPGRLAESDGAITVVFDPEDERSASRLLEVARESAPIILTDLGVDPATPLTIEIATSDEQFRSLTANSIPDWGVGVAYPRRHLVVMKSPRLVRYPLHMEQVVAHEIAHIGAGLVLGDVLVPRWFHEGVAMAESQEWRTGESARLALAVSTGSVIPLADLEHSFPSGSSAATLAYLESFQAVRFLMEEADVASPGPLVRVVAAEGSFEQGLRALYGDGATRFSKGFHDFLKRRFNWGLALSGGGIVLAVMTGLFFVAHARRVRRSRAKLREWEQEERGL